MNNTLYYEELVGRNLWVDGESSLNKEGLYDKVLSGADITGVTVTEYDDEIQKFSRLTGIRLLEKSLPNYERINDEFSIPKKYKTLDLEKYYLKKLKQRINFSSIGEDYKELCLRRIFEELELYKLKGLEDVLRTAVFIVDSFKANDIVWGPGRGSSCCSFLLYLTELHDINSLEFNLNIDEFLR